MRFVVDLLFRGCIVAYFWFKAPFDCLVGCLYLHYMVVVSGLIYV